MHYLDSQNPFSVKILDDIKNLDSEDWTSLQETNSLKLFRSAVERVPAYREFLRKEKVNPRDIKSIADFKSVPLTTKKNYLTQYPIESLCWDGNLAKPMVFTATSGSTGEPFYFLRQNQLDWQYSVILENFLKQRDLEKEGPVLVIVCFGMGLWIGGLITYKAFELAALRCKLPLSIITPGINKKEIFGALRQLAPHYKQTIIAGYPPFIKDIIDEAKNEKIKLSKLNLRILFAAESVTEGFRTYLTKKAGIKDIHLDFLSVYGSADVGAMAQENAVTILARRLSIKNKKLFRDIFSPINKTPTLAQYNPHFINFEAVDGQIVLTADSAMPLIRYAIGDSGGVFSYSQLQNVFEKHNINLDKQIETAKIKNYVSKMPFVYVYERIDLSTTFYGLWIYPEWIRDTLLKNQLLTGKFTLVTKVDPNNNQYLEVNIELKKGVEIKEKDKKRVVKNIVVSLKTASSEYREMYEHLKDRAIPRVVFWKAEDPEYFKPGVKQKWVKKE